MHVSVLKKTGDIAIGCIRRTGRPEESRRRKAGRSGDKRSGP